MLEWELIVERIQALIHAGDPVDTAVAETPEDPARRLFQSQMQHLGDHLEHFYAILTHADGYAMEELADAFCRASGKPAGYHRFVHDEAEEQQAAATAGEEKKN